MSLKNGFRKNLFLTKKLNVAPNTDRHFAEIEDCVGHCEGARAHHYSLAIVRAD